MTWMRCALWVALAMGLLSAPARAEEDEAPERLARDLLTVITMEGLPCGEVVATERHGDDDYTATCRTGDRYRVRIVDDRVRIERR